MTTLQEIRKSLVDKEERKRAVDEMGQMFARHRADNIISEDFHGFDDSICIKIFKKITHTDADEIKQWLHENCKDKFTYNDRWKKNIDGDWYLNFYFQSKKDAAQFKIFWG